jgi:diguanylate cyclase (GGDEF)-like protein
VRLNLNLLLIDDDKIDRMHSIRALDRSGHAMQVTEASSAEEGLGFHQTGQYDIILLDYQLPTMTGLELLKQFNSINNNIAVVMLSNSDDEKIAIECIEAGAQDFIVKSEITTSRLTRALFHAKERYKIEQELRDSRELMRQLAEKDSLTGLSNRHVFEEQLSLAIPRAKRLNNGLALIMLDLDNFKHINDTLGHAAGDQLLVEVADRFTRQIREGDLLCRLGGDEFAVLVYDVNDPDRIQRLTNRILNALSGTFKIEGVDLTVTTSIGVANFPDSAVDASQLLKCADIAMYRSKEMGRNQTHFYSKLIHDKVLRRVELERELYRAVENNEFTTYFQPQIECETGKIIGAEALIRWNHPTKGLVGPNEFIPIAEEIGLISDIGEWVLETTCAHLSEWNNKNNSLKISLAVAVNLSALQLVSQDFVQTISNILHKYDLEPDQLELEITESTLIKASEVSSRTLEDLSNLGIKLAIDDFGTGYSSLAQLQRYPFQILKIDKSFVHAVTDKDATFLEAINNFAKTLGITTVVEGVETQSHKDLCQKLKFDRMQGYYFAKPMPANEFETLLIGSSAQASDIELQNI